MTQVKTLEKRPQTRTKQIQRIKIAYELTKMMHYCAHSLMQIRAAKET